MTVSVPRLHSVQLKSGGAKVRVFTSDGDLRVRSCLSQFTGDSKIVNEQQSDMIGYAIVAWGKSGGTSTALYVADGKQVGMMMVPDFVKSCITNKIIADGA